MKHEATVGPNTGSKRGNVTVEAVHHDEIPVGRRTRQDPADGVESELIDKTKRHIQNLVLEIANLASSGCSTADFFEGFLNRTTTALASVGGAVWMDESGAGQIELQYQVGLEKTGLLEHETTQKRHGNLLNKLWQTGEASLVPPNSGSADSQEAGNSTNSLLIVGPIKIGHQTVGLIEIFQRTGAGPATQRGYLRFLMQMCDIASNFLQIQKIGSFETQQALWQQLDLFSRSIHQSLDPEQAAYVIANEGRRIIDCDRVSVALSAGSSCRVRAVSGLDSIERRSDQVKKLQRLTKAVLKSNEPLWYCGDDEKLPPQIESRLHNYIDKSHTRMLTIIPLKDCPVTASNEKRVPRPRTIGALIVEKLKDAEAPPTFQRRVEVVARHSQIALSNALEHHGLFLMPLWKTLGKLTRPFSSTHLPKTLLVLATLSGISCFFALFPYPFTISSNGQLQPIVQKEVFVKVDGVLKEVFLSDDQAISVSKNMPLAQMTNNELMVQIENLEGQISQTHEQIKTLKFSQAKQLKEADSIVLYGELEKAKVKLQSLQNELQIKQKQESQLLIVSPANGVIMNWQVRKNLLMRPVKRGQNLMTVVDPSGGWQIELEVPERRLGHLLKRLKESEEPVQVDFTLVSDPGGNILGVLEKVDSSMAVYSEDGNCAKAIIRFDNGQISPELLKSGTRIKAKLNCGTRSIGYVWFHELFESAQMAYKYWF